MSIKINRLEEGHNSYPLVCRRPAETVSLQRRQICYRWGTPAYWSLVPRSNMFYLFEFCLKNMWNCSLTQHILSHNFYDWKLCILEVIGHLYISIQSMPIAIKVCNLDSRDKIYSRFSFMWWSRISHIYKTNKYLSHQSSVISQYNRTCIILFLAPIVTFVVKIISNCAIFSMADVYFHTSIRTVIFIFNIRIV